mgnify:FL=1
MVQIYKKGTKKKKRDQLLAKGLKNIGNRVLVGDKYKRGKDPALDLVIKKILLDQI